MSVLANYDIIREPVLTEKATDLREDRNQVVFKVDGRANKKQIADAVESIFKVKVTGVRVINTATKPKRLGKAFGTRPGYKKAIVSLKAGDSVDIFEKVE